MIFDDLPEFINVMTLGNGSELKKGERDNDIKIIFCRRIKNGNNRRKK